MFYVKIILMMIMMVMIAKLNNRLTKQDDRDWLREQQTAISHLALTLGWTGSWSACTVEIYPLHILGSHGCKSCKVEVF